MRRKSSLHQKQRFPRLKLYHSIHIRMNPFVPTIRSGCEMQWVPTRCVRRKDTMCRQERHDPLRPSRYFPHQVDETRTPIETQSQTGEHCIVANNPPTGSRKESIAFCNSAGNSFIVFFFFCQKNDASHAKIGTGFCLCVTCSVC